MKGGWGGKGEEGRVRRGGLGRPAVAPAIAPLDSHEVHVESPSHAAQQPSMLADFSPPG
jgi:hypothetical protein